MADTESTDEKWCDYCGLQPHEYIQGCVLKYGDGSGGCARDRDVIVQLRADLHEATKLLYDWEVSTPGMKGSIRMETRDFLQRIKYPPENDDPVIHAMHEETGRPWMGRRSRIPPGFGEVCTDAEYRAQLAAEMKHED